MNVKRVQVHAEQRTEYYVPGSSLSLSLLPTKRVALTFFFIYLLFASASTAVHRPHTSCVLQVHTCDNNYSPIMPMPPFPIPTLHSMCTQFTTLLGPLTSIHQFKPFFWIHFVSSTFDIHHIHISPIVFISFPCSTHTHGPSLSQLTGFRQGVHQPPQ